jgi:tetratricopeptide (TPR) repeat protein
MKVNEKLGSELFYAIERDLTKIIHQELGDRSLWPPNVLLETDTRKGKDNRSEVGARTFIDYLYYQEKVEAVSRNRDQLNLTSGGASLLENLEGLLKASEYRNDIAHPKPLLEADVASLLKIARDLVQGGLVGGEISEVLNRSHESGSVPWTGQSDPIPKVLNNLPNREYDDTGFVGRRKVINRIVRALKSNSPMDNYIWITGLGGLGKTAIAREVAERVLWDQDQPFEVVLWVSFKTHELSTKGPVRIRESIVSAISMIQDFPLVSGGEDKTLAEVLSELGQLETLIILDNCETYPGIFQEFIEAAPPPSIKILLTSRQLGEVGRKEPIDHLDSNECRYFLRKLYETYPSPDVLNILEDGKELDELLAWSGMSPLALKWLVRACNNGSTLEHVRLNKEILIRYCVENVYNGLSDGSKRILHSLKLAGTPLSVGDLKGILFDLPSETLNHLVSELRGVGLISIRNLDARTVYLLDDTARDFLSLSETISSEDEKSVMNSILKIRKLSSSSPVEVSYSPYTVDGRDIEPLLYPELLALLKPSRKQDIKTEDLVKKANDILDSAPKYWETYRVLSELYWRLGDKVKSVELLENAVEVCPDDRSFSKSRMHYFLALRLNQIDQDRASTQFRLALDCNEVFDTVANYGRSLMFQRRHSEAQVFFDRACGMAKTSKEFFYSSKDVLDNYRREGETQKGEQLFSSSTRALEFWLDSTHLVWDCPEDKRTEMVKDVMEIISSVCDSVVQDPLIFERRSNVDQVDNLFLRADRTLGTLGYPDWLSMVDLQDRLFLTNLTKLLEKLPLAPGVLTSKIGEALEGAPISVRGVLKTWIPEKHYGFVHVNYRDDKIEAYFNLNSLKDRTDVEKLLHGRPNVWGVLVEYEGRYVLKSVVVEDFF